MNHFVKFLHLESSSFKLDFDYHYNHVLIWIMITMISIVSANYIRLTVSLTNPKRFEFSHKIGFWLINFFEFSRRKVEKLRREVCQGIATSWIMHEMLSVIKRVFMQALFSKPS